MDFVAAAANLRAHVFNIQRKSRFDIKSMAGNIVPAIATTNAVIAGLIVMEALKVLAGDFNKCKQIYLPRMPNPYKKLLVTCSLAPPNPKCYVCSPKPEANVKLNTNSVTVATLQEKILKSHFGMLAPDVDIQDGKGTILISSEEGETDSNLPKYLAEFGVKDSTRLTADDFLQNYTLILNIIHSSESLPDEKEFMVVTEEEETKEEEGVDLSVRKRKAPPGNGDEPVLQNAAKRIKDDAAAAVVQEI
jgi:ubiquitin-like 1-activating enzyme E1 B